MTRPPPGRRAEYRHYLPITTRWMDNDVFGHINNVNYYSFFDTAVTHFLMSVGILDWRGSDHIMVVAESSCRYHTETSFPDQINAGLRMARLGHSSVRYELGIFANDHDTAAAEGYFVHVCVDAAARRPAPLPPTWRTALETLGA